MDTNKVGAQLIKSISFEVEAIPQDNVVEITNTGKMTPLNVRVRVRKKEDGVVSKGIVSIPRRGQPENQIQTLRLASSEMTIMSFNMLMEADLEQQVIKKPRKSFFGICLGARGEKDDDKYLPSTADDKDVDTTSESNILKLRDVNQLGKTGISSHHVYRKKDKFFGKCKPGGCLDPPFGEDKYAYQPQDKTRIKALKAPAAAILVDTRAIAETEKMPDSKTADAANTKKNERETSSAVKLPKKENKESDSILSLYQGERKHILDENDSDSIITYPPALSSSGLLLSGEKTEKNVARKSSGARQSKKSFNELSAAYFSPPRTPRDSKDSSGRAERPKSYSTKDIKQDSKLDSRSPRRASNVNTGVTSHSNENRTNSSDRTGAEFVGLIAAATVGVEATAIRIAAAKTGESKDGEYKTTQEKDILIQTTNSMLNDNKLADTQSGSTFPAEILNKIDRIEIAAAMTGKPQDRVIGENIQQNVSDAIKDHTKDLNISVNQFPMSRPTIKSEENNLAEIKDSFHSHFGERAKANELRRFVDVATNDAYRENVKPRAKQPNGMSDVEKSKLKEQKNIIGTAADENNRSQGDRSTEQFSPHEDQQSNGRTEGIKQLRGQNRGIFHEDKGWESTDFQGRTIHADNTEGEYSPERGHLGNDYSSKLREDQEPYLHEGITESQGRIIPRDHTEEEYSPKGEQRDNESSSTSEKDREPIFQEVMDGSVRDPQGQIIPTGDIDQEYSPTRGQQKNEYSSKLGEDDQPFSLEGMNRRAIDSQCRILSRDNTAEEFSPNVRQIENNYTSKLGGDWEPFAQEGMDQKVKDSLGRNIQRGDTEQDYSLTRGQRRKEYSSELGKDQEPYYLQSMEAMDPETIDSAEKIFPRDDTNRERTDRRDDTQREYSPTRVQRETEYSSKLRKDGELYSEDGLGHKIATDKTGQRAEDSKHGVIQRGIYSASDKKTINEELQRAPSQKEFEELQKSEGDPTSQSDDSAVDTIQGKWQDRYGSASGVTVKPTDQTTGSIFLNLAFQTSNEENQTTIKTLDIAKDNIDNRNVLFVKSLIKFGRGIVVPISSQHVMNIEIKPAPNTSTDAKSRISNFNSAKSEFKSDLSINDPHTALSIVYNKDLIPLRSVIKDLKEDINALATQQMMLRDRLATRRIKPYNNIKKCGCSRHSYPKI